MTSDPLIRRPGRSRSNYGSVPTPRSITWPISTPSSRSEAPEIRILLSTQGVTSLTSTSTRRASKPRPPSPESRAEVTENNNKKTHGHRPRLQMRGLPIEPRVPVGIPEREIALAPVLILNIADFHAQFLQTCMLGVDIIDLNLDVQARTSGR